MNEEKRSRIMLDISLWLMAAYCVLFLGCYALQYEPWVSDWFGMESVMGMSLPTEIPRPFSSVIVLSVLLFSAVTIVLDILLKNRSSSALCIGASVFAGCAFSADRLIKGIVPDGVTRFMSIEGPRGVVMAGYHANAVRFLDMLLFPVFAASLTLMVCVCYNKHLNSTRKENYNGC